MSGKQYLKNQLPVILINLLGMLVLALFLIASDNPIQTVLFIFAVWSIVLVLSLLAFYFSRKKYLNKFCLLYTSPSPRDISGSRMPSSA